MRSFNSFLFNCITLTVAIVKLLPKHLCQGCQFPLDLYIVITQDASITRGGFEESDRTVVLDLKLVKAATCFSPNRNIDF